MKIYQLQQENWGVCGFIAAIQAAHTNEQEIIIDSDKKSISSKFNKDLAEKKEVLTTSNQLLNHFIKIFDQYCSPEIATSIVTFTRSFGDEFKKPTNDVYALSVYCKMMNDDTAFTNTDLAARAKPALGFAMTPEGMNFLLQKIFHFNTGSFQSLTASEWNLLNDKDKELKFRNRIIGLTSNINDKQNYNGLKHWVYIDKEGKLYSWGEEYKSLKDFLNVTKYEQVCYMSSPLA